MGEMVRPHALTIPLTVATVCGCLFWYLGSPGPTLLDDVPRSHDAAVSSVRWALILLLAIPLVAALAMRRPVSGLGLAVGDARFGIKAVLIVIALAAVPMFFGARDPQVQATYPWPGLEVGQSTATLVRWAAIYLGYYLAFEFFFRGYLMDAIRPHWGENAANWTQAIACTLIHVGKPLPETLSALPASLLFGLLASRTRSIVWPVVLHLTMGLIADCGVLYWQGKLLP